MTSIGPNIPKHKHSPHNYQMFSCWAYIDQALQKHPVCPFEHALSFLILGFDKPVGGA